jgi:hypothetical protein
MPSPFQQKYSSQSHKVFGDSPVPIMPEAPKQDADRRASDASMTDTPPSPDTRRRVSYLNIGPIVSLLMCLSRPPPNDLEI